MKLYDSSDLSSLSNESLKKLYNEKVLPLKEKYRNFKDRQVLDDLNDEKFANLFKESC